MKLLEALKAELVLALPGKEAQVSMAPVGREPNETTSVKRNAAVTIVILDRPEKSHEIILIKRSEYDGPHSDQVSFPGGKQETSDSNLIDTAIRECYEETGLELKIQNLAGTLTPLYISVSRFMVFPYIFIFDQMPNFNTDPMEVNYIIRFPLNQLMQEDLKQNKMIEIEDQKIEVPYYAIENEVVWGATAMILSEFIEILKRIETKNPGLI
jgi:8-oxo-dGTP pyrophosphatase MutT (NUDIX family)